MVFDTLGVEFGAMWRHADRNEEINDQAMASADTRSEIKPTRRKKHAAIELRCRQAFALQPADALDRRGMRHPEPARDIGRPRLPLRRQKIVDQLDIILKHRRGLRGTCLFEPRGLYSLRRKLTAKR